MNPKDVLRILGGLRVLRFFPNDEAAMSALVQLCGSMCSSTEQVQWLVNRVTSGIYAEWPGPQEMRACLCNRHKPKDGINAYSSVYPDGFPPDPTVPRRAIEGPELLALPEGKVSTDPFIDKAVGIAIAVNGAKCSDKFSAPATAAEVAAAPKWLRQLEGYE